MTKFLVDENVPPAVDFLKDKGFDVKEVRELSIPGTSNGVIMGLARQEERALVTFDKHFSDILRYPLDSHFGVIRIRIHPPLLSDIIQALEHFLENFDLKTIRRTLIVLEREGF
jgi:predicted nuclease of predicted toxin-antitoxin system